MQQESRTLADVLEYAAVFHGQVELVSRRVEDGRLHRYNYAQALQRTRQLARALRGWGVRPGDRIATMAWNTHRHFEAWYAITGLGAICHTVNPRLFDTQLEFILNHAQDLLLLVDLSFLPIVERLRSKLPCLKAVVVLSDEACMPATDRPDVLCYESWIGGETDEVDWPRLEPDTPSSLCYTSGTTGNPKGVLYTHRSNLLHADVVNNSGVFGISCADSVLMAVPMFHANSWGLAYSCPMAGAKLIMPGAQLDGESIFELLDEHQVSFSAGVPTVWSNLLQSLRGTDRKLPCLREVVTGGSAVPRWMIETFDREYGVRLVHAWGMTEMSPTGTSSRLKTYMQSWSYERQLEMRVKQGHPVYGVAMKIVDDNGSQLPHDGASMGRLLVKGPWVVRRYFREDHDCVDADGWLDTGDIATIDPHGFMQITDRAKDLIKSGGEWISSVELENLAAGHPAVKLAAVIGVASEKWGERPLLVVEAERQASVTAEEILDGLRGKVAKWWLPDAVAFVDEIPLTATGKINKRLLRQQFRDRRPTADKESTVP